MDSGRTELDGPFCFMCERTEGLIELKREKMSKEVMFNRIKAVNDRMMENLRQAYDIRKEDWPQNPEEEMMLLEAMATGQDLQTAIREMAEGKKEKSSKKSS